MALHSGTFLAPGALFSTNGVRVTVEACVFTLDLLSSALVFADLDSDFGLAWHSRMNFFNSLGGVGGVDFIDTDDNDDATLRSLASGVGVSSHFRTTNRGGCTK